jgi:hypothetical protein
MFKKVLLFVVVSLFLFACQSMPTTEPVEVMKNSTVTAHLVVNYLSEEKIELDSEEVQVVKHTTSNGCFMTLPGEDGQSSELFKIKLNTKARDIENNANRELTKFGTSPYTYFSNLAAIMGDSCDLKDVYATVALLVSYGQQEGGFLKYSNITDHEYAYVYLPISFYDFVLKDAAEATTTEWKYEYPNISQVGGYQVETGDPNGLVVWMDTQTAFLETVYGREASISATEGKIEYTTSSNYTSESGSGCHKRNWANHGSCSDWGPNVEQHTSETPHEVDAEYGILSLTGE